MKRFALVCLTLGLLTACRKDDVIVCVFPTPTALADVMVAAPPVQTFTFALNQPQSLRTSRGTVIAFGPNSLVLPDGSLATGTATLRVRELHSVGDIVLAGLHTNLANNTRQLLVSAGEFNVQLWQGTTRLRWKTLTTTSSSPLATLTAPVPQAGLDTTRMFLWNLPFGPTAAAVRPALADSVGWQPVRQGGQNNWNPLLQNNGFYTATLPLDTISWLNFDQYWRPGSPAVWTWAEVRVPAGALETRVYIRPVGYTSLCRTFGTANDPTRWRNHFPEGTDVQAIVLQAREGRLYFGTQRYRWQGGQVVEPTLQALSAAEIVQRIQQL